MSGTAVLITLPVPLEVIILELDIYQVGMIIKSNKK